jgi:hypothetical protein
MEQHRVGCVDPTWRQDVTPRRHQMASSCQLLGVCLAAEGCYAECTSSAAAHIQ